MNGLFLSSVISMIVATAPGDDRLEIWIGGWFSHNVLRIDWQTGALIDEFIPPQGGGILEPHDYSFGPDGHFYVASHGNNSVRKFDRLTGVFIEIGGLPGRLNVASVKPFPSYST